RCSTLALGVQEILDLKPCDLQLEKPYYVRLFGKGRKERICALWPQTAAILKEFLSERQVEVTSAEPLFRNHRAVGGHAGCSTETGTRTVISVPFCGSDVSDIVPFTRLTLSLMLISPMPSLYIAAGSKPTPESRTVS